MTKNNKLAQDLLLSEAYRLPVLGQVLDFLNLAGGSQGLEVGCGIGSLTLLLAGAVGEKGRVTGLDLDNHLLDLAGERAGQAGLGGRIGFKPGDMTSLPFEDAAFDWLISVDCAGYAPSEDPAALVKSLARVVKPGGFLSLAAWSSQMLLPGHPQLEARLNTTPDGLAPFESGSAPESHFLNALGWFRKAGLIGCRTATLAGQLQAPLSEKEKAALLELISMRWPGVEKDLPESEAQLFQELTDPDSKTFILDRPDYQAFFTYTVFKGLKP